MRIFPKPVSQILILLTIFCTTFSLAKPPDITFTHFTEAQGLPSLHINAIFQDHLGYIWIGTLNGLARYDGYEFKHYSPDAGDFAGRSVNIVSGIYEDSRGDLWIGWINGISKFNRSDETFTFFDISEFAIGGDQYQMVCFILMK